MIKVRVQKKGCTNMQSYIKAAQVVLPGDGGEFAVETRFHDILQKIIK